MGELDIYEMMTLEEVIQLTRMSESTIRRNRDPKGLKGIPDPFPEPVHLSKQLQVYPRAKVLAWLDRRMGNRPTA